jgi:hypothetical protein
VASWRAGGKVKNVKNVKNVKKGKKGKKGTAFQSTALQWFQCLATVGKKWLLPCSADIWAP